ERAPRTPLFQVPWLWTGSEFHLWFLPFLLYGTILTGIACRLTGKYPRVRLAVIISSALFGAFLAVAPRPHWLDYDPWSAEGFFFLTSWKALPALFLGTSFAWWLADHDEEIQISPALGFIGLLLVATMVANQFIHGYSRLDRTLS